MKLHSITHKSALPKKKNEPELDQACNFNLEKYLHNTMKIQQNLDWRIGYYKGNHHTECETI